jgi:hypothetical protein
MEMKKILGLLLVALIGFAVTAGGASAGTLALTADQATANAAALNQTAIAAYYYPAEAVGSATVTAPIQLNFSGAAGTTNMPAAVLNVGGAVVKSITYKPTTNLPSGTRVIFTLTNGKWKDATYYLLKQVGADFDGVTVASADSITNNVLTFIVGSTAIDAGTIMLLSSAQDATQADTAMDGVNPIITMDAALATAGTGVTVAVTECYDSVGPIVGGLAGAKTLVTSYQQFAWTRVEGSDDINVESPDLRKKFLLSAVTPLTPGSLKLEDSQAAVDVDPVLAGNQVANFGINLSVASLATLDYSVTGAQLLKLVATTGLKFNMDNGGVTLKNFTRVSDTSATLSIATDDSALWYNGTADTLIFTVLGTVTLDTQSFNATALLNFTDNAKYNDVALGSGSVMVWGINGW